MKENSQPEDVQLDVEAARQIIAELISSAQFYETYERAMAPGIADGWPDIIPAPHTKNGRLYKVATESLVEKLQLALLRRVSGKGAQRQWPHKAGGIIDAWDGLSNDCASDPDLETLGKLINEMRKEIGDAGPSPAPVPATASIEALKERAEKAFTHNFKGLDYSNVGRKELAIDFAVNFALKEWATTQGTPEGAK